MTEKEKRKIEADIFWELRGKRYLKRMAILDVFDLIFSFLLIFLLGERR